MVQTSYHLCDFCTFVQINNNKIIINNNSDILDHIFIWTKSMPDQSQYFLLRAYTSTLMDTVFSLLPMHAIISNTQISMLYLNYQFSCLSIMAIST